MLKKIYRLAGILILVGLILGVVGIVTLGKDKFLNIFYEMSDDSEYVQETYESETEITKLDLQFVNRNVVIERDDVSKIQVSYYQSEKDRIEFTETEGNLIVTNDVRWQFFTLFNYVSNEKRMVNIIVPNVINYELKIVTTNGNIMLEDLDTLSKVNVDTTNGTIKLINTDVLEEVDLRASNGSILVTDGLVDSLLVDTLNGEITIGQIVSQDIQAESTNGSIHLTQITCDNIQLEATNGTIYVQVVGQFEDYKITLRTVNGKIKYNDLNLSSGTIHPTASKILVAETVNGGINIDFTE